MIRQTNMGCSGATPGWQLRGEGGVLQLRTDTPLIRYFHKLAPTGFRGLRGTSIRILLTGSNGQIGWQLRSELASLGDVVTTDRTTLDLADSDAIRRTIRTQQPDLIVNAAAYTQVDAA